MSQCCEDCVYCNYSRVFLPTEYYCEEGFNEIAKKVSRFHEICKNFIPKWVKKGDLETKKKLIEAIEKYQSWNTDKDWEIKFKEGILEKLKNKLEEMNK